ncbi:MAG: hypothetical protein GY717_06245 [Rhodobacteraceae bacterium]|nr:hypothetical protein [Paracoccaceae bacterium]
MHIEPGVIDGAKLALAVATAAGAGTYAIKLAMKDVMTRGPLPLIGGIAASTVGVFAFFQLLPHFPVGISEVHFILGSTLFLMFGPAAAAFGLALGLLIQGLTFAPTDLPMYFVNITTLLVPLFALQALATRIIAPGTAYVDLKYSQTLALSTAYQGGIVAWVAFWAFYGQGFAATSSVLAFGGAYMMIVLIEPLIDLAVLAGAKSLRDVTKGGIFTPRLHSA